LEEFSYVLMNFCSTSAKTDCRNEYTISKMWENSHFEFYNSIHVAKKFTGYFSMYGKSRNHMKDTVFFILIIFHLSSLKQIAKMKTSHINCGESSLKILFNVWKIKKTT